MAQTHDFVQRVNPGKDCPTSILLHLPQQIVDIKRFCCSGSTVLGIDKTFNLGKVYATVTAFKDLRVNKRGTLEHPFFIGPSLQHCKSDYETFSFFSFICVKSWVITKLWLLVLRMSKLFTKQLYQHFPPANTHCAYLS